MTGRIRAKRWCFTTNNPTEDDEQYFFGELSEHELVEYLCIGREVGESGTPHFQGYVIFKQPRSTAQARELLPRSHLTVSRGTPKQASDYCKKDGNYEEFGELPASQGKRTDIDRYVEWLKSLEEGTFPTERDIANAHPNMYCKYKARALELREHILPRPSIQAGQPKDWQVRLREILEAPAEDRPVIFATDEEGGKGKSWFCRWMMTELPEQVQCIGVGKRDDIAHSIDPSKRIFLMNVPRTQMEYLNYSVLEMIKDRLVYSPKYESQMKVIRSLAHVVVFSNELPDMNKMTHDRYQLFEF